VDIQEIDGASNRGIDDIRSLRANVGVKSMRTKYKIYIIDEVHMLTKEAFNALLKTLEEPPPNVKFVFCTTEPHKVPDTILSRCQRFDFSSIDMTNLIMRLTEIAEQEGISVSADAVELVARRAGGSMRDSQSLFDQLLAFGNEHVTADDVNRLLGTASDDRLCSILESAYQHQAAACLRHLADSLSQGVQITNLADQLILCVRDMMVMAAGADDLPLLGIGEISRARIKGLSAQIGLMTINASLQILADVKSKMSRVVSPRPLLELGLVRITLLEDLSTLKAVVEQLRQHPGQPAVIHLHAPSGYQQSPLPSHTKTGKTLDQAPRITSLDQKLVPVGTHKNVHEPPANTNANNSATDPDSDDQVSSIAPPSNFLPEEPPKAVWDKIIKLQDDATQSYLNHVETVNLLHAGILEISFPEKYKFSKTKLESKTDILSQLELAWKKLTGTHRKIRFNIIKTAAATQNPVHESAPPPKTSSHMQLVEKDPFVKKVQEIFQANLIKVDKLLPE
jgi:DNA polymerase-3 subunit gamma/tau